MSKLLIFFLLLSLLATPLLAKQPYRINQCSVNSIFDGDTIRVSCERKKYKVRLYCIDAPEIEQRPWGKESEAFLRSRLKGKVDLLVHGHDTYGRKLAEVFVGNSNINLESVRSGKAVVYARYCPFEKYFQAEYNASQAGRGVWSKWGLQQVPWLWRKQYKDNK